MNLNASLNHQQISHIMELYPRWINIDIVWRCKDFLMSWLILDLSSLNDQQLQLKLDSFKNEFAQFLNKQMQALTSPDHILTLSHFRCVIEKLNTSTSWEIYTSLRESMTKEWKFLQEMKTSIDGSIEEAGNIKKQILEASTRGVLNSPEAENYFIIFFAKTSECIQIGQNSVTEYVNEIKTELKAKKFFEIYMHFKERLTSLLTSLVTARKLVCEFSNIKLKTDNKNKLLENSAKLSKIIQKLLSESFILEEEPRQVLKAGAKFNVKIGLSYTNIYETQNPKVVAYLINEKDAAAIFKAQEASGNFKNCGEIKNSVCEMIYDKNSGSLKAVMNDLKLEKFKRSGKTPNNNVTEGKFAFLFESSIKILGYNFSFYRISPPVVIIVHGSQEMPALATIFWDNYFAEPNRIPFKVPDEVSWKDFSTALSEYFLSEIGRGLDEDKLNYLGAKILSNQQNFANNIPPNPTTRISLNMFCKENMSDSLKITFSEWMCKAIKLLKEHMRDYWARDLIIGFISKEKAENLLKNCEDGTFMLRFSDSEPGKISISWIFRPHPTAEGIVAHIKPRCAIDLEKRSLLDSLHDLDKLKILYPSTPKEIAFPPTKPNESNFSDPSRMRKQYVDGKLVFVADTPGLKAATPELETPVQGNYEMQPYCYNPPSASCSVSPYEYDHYQTFGDETSQLSPQNQPFETQNGLNNFPTSSTEQSPMDEDMHTTIDSTDALYYLISQLQDENMS